MKPDLHIALKKFKAAYNDMPSLTENYKKTRDDYVDSNLQTERDKSAHAATMLRKLHNIRNILCLHFVIFTTSFPAWSVIFSESEYATLPET